MIEEVIVHPLVSVTIKTYVAADDLHCAALVGRNLDQSKVVQA